MTVRDLIDRLLTVPADMQVILASDAEGNYHYPVASILIGRYERHDPYRGDFESTHNRDEQNALVLVPAR